MGEISDKLWRAFEQLASKYPHDEGGRMTADLARWVLRTEPGDAGCRRRPPKYSRDRVADRAPDMNHVARGISGPSNLLGDKHAIPVLPK